MREMDTDTSTVLSSEVVEMEVDEDGERDEDGEDYGNLNPGEYYDNHHHRAYEDMGGHGGYAAHRYYCD